ncbi:MAG: hypothetical protein AB1424_09360 [Thermodesulfobacteriota bacterium]
MQTIEIDWDVFKEITIRRKNEDITPNDVLREVFGLEPRQGPRTQKAQSGKPWVAKGVVFPHGTEFRGFHKGKLYYAKVDDGSLTLNGEKFASPSAAAVSITGNSVNGWVFWECKLPGKVNWQSINTLRKKIMPVSMTADMSEFV